MPSHATPFTPDAVLSDALLVQRIAALSDKTALAELDGRHGMTLYAIAYSLLLDREAADEVVATAFREVWRSAASCGAGSPTSLAAPRMSICRPIRALRWPCARWVGGGAAQPSGVRRALARRHAGAAGPVHCFGSRASLGCWPFPLCSSPEGQ